MKSTAGKLQADGLKRAGIELLSRIPSVIDHDTPLLFVHGAWHGAWCWEKYFLPYFAEKGYRAYALSLRGHGGSFGKSAIRRYRVSHYVEDVRAIVRRLGREPILIGHSLGGHVVQKYLESFPAPAAVLMASVPVGGIVKMLKRLARDHPLRFLKANALLALYPFVSTPAMAQEMLFSDGMDRSEILEYFKKLEEESYFSFLDMLFLSPLRPRRIKSEVLVMGAENDRVFYRRDIRKTGRAYNHKAIILPGMAHDMMLDLRWRQAADIILDWLLQKGL